MKPTENVSNEHKKSTYLWTGLRIFYIAIFFLISLTPLGLFVYTYSAGITGDNIEKSEMLDFPVIYDESGINESFDDQCESWINQNIPFRGQMISGINYVLSENLKIPTANVVPGIEEWIYSNETLGDYMNTNEMSEEDIRNIGITLSLIQERVSEWDGTFLFAPVPNKNSVYPENMPKRYLKSEGNNLSKLYHELDSAGVCYVNLLEEMRNAKDDAPVSLYYKRDTHWNVFGALTGYNAMLQSLGRTPLKYDVIHYSDDDSRVGDLDKLLYPSFAHYEKAYDIDYHLDYDSFAFIFPTGVEDTQSQLENFMSDAEDHDNNFTTMKRQADQNTSLYMIRDSFGRALLPFMINSYSEATFVRSLTPSFEKTEGCDDVIYEICERNLKNVIESAPFMYAPIRENIYTNTISFNSDYNTCFYEEEGFALKIYGTVDSKMIGQDGRIHIRLFDDSQVLIYEAFPILEKDLILKKSAEYQTDKLINSGRIQGYSLYVNKDELKEDHIRIRLISGDYESDVLSDFSLMELGSSMNDYHETAANPYRGENTDYQLVYRGTTFGIGDNMNDIKVALGNQAAPSEIVTSCLSGTDAIMYYYPNITIESDMEGNIYYISLMNNSYSDGQADATTTKGITIGSDLRHIWDILGTPDTENDRNCSYRTEHLKITYSYKNGSVTSIILEDRKFIQEEEDTLQVSSSQNGVEYDKGNTYLYDDAHALKTGWQIIDGEYYFFDRITGERIVGQTVDGIVIDEDGGVQLSQYEEDKIATMMKAHKIMEENTDPSDTMEEKRRKVFLWVMSFPYNRLRSLKDYYENEGVEIMEANDIFDDGIGDCVSEAAAVAFLFHEIGYNNVYWAHDTGHAWVRCDDRLFDPLFAESRGFDANYDAPFTDFRGNTNHMMLIY